MKKHLLLVMLMAFVPLASLAEEWIDVTYLFVRNPSFGGNNRIGWTCNYSAYALNVKYECMEVFDGTFDICQILSDLPKGDYRLSAQAFYRAGSHKVAYWNRQDGSEGLTAVIYAGDNEQIVKSIYDCTFSGVADDLWSPDNNSFYPNWMYSASVQFVNGEYINTLEFNTEGTLQIGIKNNNHIDSDWCIFDNFSLSYKGTLDISVYKSALMKAVKVAQDMQGKIPTELFNQLMLVVNDYNKNYSTRDDYYAAIQSIYEAIDSYASETATNRYNDFLTLKSYIQALYNVTPYREDFIGAHETLRQAISNAEKDASNATTVEELNSIIETLRNAGIKYVNNASPIGNAKFDITFMLTNPDLHGIDAWNKADGWYTDQTEGNSQVMVSEWATSDDGVHDKFYEYWSETAKDNNLFTVYQKVTLPTGKYDFSCYAFASGGNSGDGVYLYANDTQCAEVYDSRLSETSMTFRQANTNATEVKIGLKVLSGNAYNWMGIGYAHLYKVYDIESDKSAIKANDVTLTVPKTTMGVGETMNVSASISPANATLQEVKWSSSDPFVFCVDKNGKITTYSSGSAKLIATTLDGSNICKEQVITVTEKQVVNPRTWTDMSYAISNTNFDTAGNSEGWDIENEGNTAVRSGCLEFWNNTHFKTSQVIENLPKGHYRLSVQAFHRYGNCKRDYKRLMEGESTSLAYVFVDNKKQTLAPYCSYFETTKPSDEWISPDNGKHWVPNTMESASDAFAKDAYWNYLEFDVEQEQKQKDVTIGIALDEYTEENWCIFTNFKLESNVEIDLGKTYTLSVLDESGKDLSREVTIRWYDGQGNELGSGASIGGIKKDTELYYSVSLGESLGKQYREVTKQKASLEEETIVCQLQRIEEVTLHGKVSAYGTPLYRAEVNLTQWLNGKYEYTASTLTDAKGEFTLNAYNDSTELIVLANGYIDNKIVRRHLNNGGELGTIEMNEVQGKVIAINLSYQEATKEGVEPIIQNWYSDTRNIGYNVQNLTKGTEITDYAIQQGNIVLPTGTDRGDRIQITVSSLNDKFSEVKAEGIIADNDTANVDITLLAFGGIEAVYSQKADDNLLAMLYDSTGKLQMRTICSSSRLTLTNLSAGTYSLVTMGYNGAIGSVADLSDLASMDLSEGTDYVKSSATVRDGYIASINVASVPELDASKFEYTGTNTSYMPNKTQLVAGNFITLTARLDFKEQYAGKTENAKVIVEIPEGCEFVPNSVVIGAKPISHSLNGNRLTITVDKEDLDRRIRFCVIPTETGTYMTTAYAEFDYKGTKTQPIGQIKFESTSGDYYVPSTTRTPTIMVGGIGVPKADVEVYDGESLIGTTMSLANGKWSLNCELNNAYNLSTHSIYVKYRGEGNVVGKTDAKDCLYDINAVVVQSVTMLNTAHPAGNLTPTQYSSVWDFHALTSSKDYYLYWPEYPDFTFLVNLSENDTTKVSNVILSVYTMDGDIRRLPATYDGKHGCFVATSSFDSYSAPVNVSVNFNSKTAILGDSGQAKDVVEQCDDILAEDDLLRDMLDEMKSSNYSSELLFDKLFDYLNVSDELQEEIPDNISVLLDEIIQSNNCPEFEYVSGVMKIRDEEGNIITAKNTTLAEENLTMDDLKDYYLVPLTDGSNLYLQINRDVVDVVYDGRVFSFGISNDINTEMAKMTRAISSDEYFTRWSQFKATLDGLNYLSQKNKIIANIKDFLLGGLNKLKTQLHQCREIKYAYSAGSLSPQQLKELDVNKLEDCLSNLPVQIQKVEHSIARLNVLFKLIDIASVINDINKAIESRRSWNEIIDNIESIDCWEMVELSSKAKSHRQAVAIGYTTNIATNVATCVGADKLLGFVAMASGALGATASSLSMATMMEICGVISAAVTDFVIIQGGLNEWNDIRWQADIRLKIPVLKGKCNEDDDDDNNDDDKDKRKNKDPKTKDDDPSGFVYEAVPTNRVEGVKATIYFAEDGEVDYPIQWNAEEHGQINPQITVEDGLYAWDVPQGLWKVVFEKAGYETTQTDWLPVPPPQLEVNIPMSQAVAPYVEDIKGMESGITLSFSKYMKPNTLTKSSRVSVTCNGKKVGGDVELLNLEENPFNKEEYASKIKFVPNTAFTTSDEVIITVKKEVESYANKQMTEDFVQRVKIESEITEIACDSMIAVDYQGTGVLEISVLPAAAAKGRTVQIASSSSMIAATDVSNVTLNDEGKARITVSGELPGNASLHLSMPEASKEKYVVVNVVTKEAEVVKMPKASKLSGSSFEDSYMLTLTCATKGATIYYTLDGSCPCDEQTRKKYTGPIILPEGQVTLQAIAVREGMTDSDVAEFTYTVTKDVSGIKVVEESRDFECNYQDGSIIVSGAKGASCRIYDIQGRELGSRSRLSNQSRINVPKTDVYIVSVLFSNEQTVVHKIMAK